ncbi:Alpha-mannosidase I MNS5 [Zea mays]|uniref:alpha-1,2-Mannosidase n=1 Tax=Zea mays TaxID=4577 RepID=A0A1D6HJW3_MAIZE|nr:Alpha-mannosidase I MNS5 [Zea mays]
MRSPGRRLPAPARLVAAALLLAALTGGAVGADGYGRARRVYMKNKVLEMFYHAYDNYMTYAFPHDELKPLTKSFTDSLSELGNLNVLNLVVLGNLTEFERGVLWLSENLTFDVDARINLFECNIRLLGGLISAHILAKDYSSQFKHGLYQDQLLRLAESLGNRFLPAFETPTGLPYSWINLKYGVMENETTETSTSGCGSLILEMGVLSRLTGDSRYEAAALRALRKLWSMRSSLNLVGTTLDVFTGKWIQYSSGIGAGVDSFYEYLIKAYILFGSDEYWDMFHSAYLAVQKYFRHGPWYHEADMRTGEATHWQLTSLQAFWPGLQFYCTEQTLLGDVTAANLSHREFYNIWQRFGVLPERYTVFNQVFVNGEQKYTRLRSTIPCVLNPWYLEVGETIVRSLNYYTKVDGGFASIRDVSTMKLEDHQHSFFLSETCKYLFLLYDDSFLRNQNYIFTTEGHPLPIRSTWHEKFPAAYVPSNWTSVKDEIQPIRASALSSQVCPETIFGRSVGTPWESACHVPDAHASHRCRTDDDCGIEAITCKKRTCSMAGYCGLFFYNGNKSSGFSMIMRTANTSRLLQLRTAA